MHVDAAEVSYTAAGKSLNPLFFGSLGETSRQ
jgi:hypothetical protein